MSKTERPILFAEWLATEMHALDVSTAHLAESAQVTPAAVYGWLDGKRPAGPSVASVITALGVAPVGQPAAWAAYHRTVKGTR